MNMEENSVIPTSIIITFTSHSDHLIFLLVDISTSFGEVLYANVSLLRNRKFDLISQLGWIITTQLRKLWLLFARLCAAIAVCRFYTYVFEHRCI